MAATNVIPDGNKEIATDIPLIVRIIARTARWVHPQTFQELQVWCPWAARGRPLYEKTWQRPATNTRRDTGSTREKFEANVDAGKALVAALGVASPKPRNWTVCHIWGYDDEAFKAQSNIVRNPRYYSCVGNMVWLPTPLKGFTDTLPEKICSEPAPFTFMAGRARTKALENRQKPSAAALCPKVIPEAGPVQIGQS